MHSKTELLNNKLKVFTCKRFGHFHGMENRFFMKIERSTTDIYRNPNNAYFRKKLFLMSMWSAGFRHIVLTVTAIQEMS